MLYQTSYLNHAASVHKAAAALGLTAQMDLSDFGLTLSGAATRTRWHPRFVNSLGEGQFAYSADLRSTCVGFIGWLPYRSRGWETATDKLAFKHWAVRHGIATPAACVDAALIAGPFLVKKVRSSFGTGVYGPFLRPDPASPVQRLDEGEHYENFIPGHIVKATYWGSRLGAIEFRRMPAVTGDGKATVRSLVEALAPKPGARPHDWQAIDNLSRLCGLRSADDVPAPGHEVLVDYKYGSRYEPSVSRNRNIIEEIRATPLGAQFDRAGEVFARSIHDAADVQESTLFTLDAIVDAQGTAWFLEMNSNPMVQPDLYPAMLSHPGV